MSPEDNKRKEIFIPLGLLCLAVILIAIKLFFPVIGEPKNFSARFSLAILKFVSFLVVLVFEMWLCGQFEHPFIPFGRSLLQLFATAMIFMSLSGILVLLVGQSLSFWISIVIFLGLVGYFLNEEPMNALIAIFMIYSTNAVVEFLLIPFVTSFLL